MNQNVVQPPPVDVSDLVNQFNELSGGTDVI